MKKLIFVLGILLCIPMLSVLANLYWWSLTDVWLVNTLMTQDKIISAFIFAGLSLPVFAIASAVKGEKLIIN